MRPGCPGRRPWGYRRLRRRAQVSLCPGLPGVHHREGSNIQSFQAGTICTALMIWGVEAGRHLDADDTGEQQQIERPQVLLPVPRDRVVHRHVVEDIVVLGLAASHGDWCCRLADRLGERLATGGDGRLEGAREALEVDDDERGHGREGPAGKAAGAPCTYIG